MTAGRPRNEDELETVVERIGKKTLEKFITKNNHNRKLIKKKEAKHEMFIMQR